MNSGRFEYEWAVPTTDDVQVSVPRLTSNPPLSLPHNSTPLISNTTKLFIPSLLTSNPPRRLCITGFSPSEYIHDETHQTLSITPLNTAPGMKHKVVIELDPPLEPLFSLNSFWGDFGGKLSIVGAVVLAVVVYLVKG